MSTTKIRPDHTKGKSRADMTALARNIKAQAPALSKDKPLTERAVLAHVYVAGWQARKHSAAESDAVIAKHQAQHGAARVHMALLARKAISGIAVAQGNLRQYHYEMTLPWAQSGARLLPIANYFPAMDGYRKLIEVCEREAAKLLDNYDALVEEAKLLRGTMFDANDYPNKAKLAGRFVQKIIVSPLGDPNDFRIGGGVGPEELERIKQDYEQRAAEALVEAMREPWERLFKAVETLHERIKDYRQDAKGAERGTFRDSCFDQLRAMVDLIPRLNLTNDKQLEAMRQRIEERLCTAEPEVLREHADEHRLVVSEAAAIMDAMRGYMG